MTTKQKAAFLKALRERVEGRSVDDDGLTREMRELLDYMSHAMAVQLLEVLCLTRK